MSEKALQWIVSAGGPLLVIDKCFVLEWKGYEGGLDEDKGPSYFDDYERACKVDGYVGVIDVGPGKALVLGDAPLPTAWYPFPDRTGGLIIRKWYVNDDSLSHHLAKLRSGKYEPEANSFDVISSEVCIFDSACPGEEVDCTGANCALSFSLIIGRYQIGTLIYEPDQETHLVVHRLRYQ